MPIQKISVIGLPMDLGQTRRGVDMGPSASVVQILSSESKSCNIEVEDLGDIIVGRPETC